MRIENVTIRDGREDIDGKEYVDCRFVGTIMVYSGGELPAFERCTFTNYRLAFDGPALNTLSFLQAMAEPGSGFEPIIAQMFPPRS